VLITGVLLTLVHSFVFDMFLSFPIAVRTLVASLLIFPLGFFLGMPFPLGSLAIEKRPRGAVAWAWGLNGLFTLAGGLTSVLVSVWLGFRVALWLALAVYAIALVMFSRMRDVAV
jgi:hypothetical protein